MQLGEVTKKEDALDIQIMALRPIQMMLGTWNDKFSRVKDTLSERRALTCFLLGKSEGEAQKNSIF